MRKITKSIFILAGALVAGVTASAQWCPVTTAIPYSTDMPGITNVTINTINRTSLPIENYPNDSYVYTGMSTTLEVGQTYTISITHTRDAVLFPTVRNNIRVWIDYNHDYTFDDPGETVVSLNYQTYGTSTASFTVPATAAAGTTRMRVTAKMSDDGGHTLPTPCDNPPDPLGYHGEVEDYDVIISSATGLGDLTASVNTFTLSPNPATTDLTIDYTLAQPTQCMFSIYDMVGKRIYVAPPAKKSEGKQKLELKLSDINITEGGVYFCEMILNDKKTIQKFVVR